MTLHQKQVLFSNLFSHFVIEVQEALGYEAVIDSVARKNDPLLHGVRLAGDLLLFKNGKYLTRTEDYVRAGALWKSKHPLCCWGGDFKKKDGNHFSVAHGGMK